MTSMQSESTSEPDRLERLFLEQLPLIERLLRALAARNGYFGDDADDLGSWVKARLIEQNYAVLAKFRGESTISSYLAVVLAMQVREYRVTQWGRWRPSAAARELGEVGIRLEMLVHRDGVPARQAAEQLHASIASERSVAELVRLASLLPRRDPLRPRMVGDEGLAQWQGTQAADEGIDRAHSDRVRSDARAALERAIGERPAAEQVMLRMRFWHGLSVAEVARAMSLPQKPLYRTLERTLRELRQRVEGLGVSRERVRELLGDAPNASIEPSEADAAATGENLVIGPSSNATGGSTTRSTLGEPQ